MMKMFKSLAIIACIGAIFCVSGCGSKTSDSSSDSSKAEAANTPEAVVEDWLKTIQDGKLDQAYLEAHLKGFDKKIADIKNAAGDDKEKAKKIDAAVQRECAYHSKIRVEKIKTTFDIKTAKFTVGKSAGDDNLMVVMVKLEQDGKETEIPLSAAKVNGKWMITDIK